MSSKGQLRRRLVIVDGSNYIYRAFFALQQSRAGGRNVQLSTSKGMPTGALHVFTAMLLRLYLDEKPELAAVVFDTPGRTFRHSVDASYKANRPETPDDLKLQLPWFEKIVTAFRLPVLNAPADYEADDLIATLVRKARALGFRVDIFSGDKDLMQLVGDDVHVIDSMRDIRYDPARVEKKFGVGPDLVGQWLALKGDSTDNVPGVPGVGDKTATKLLLEHGSIDGILASTDKLKGKIKERFEDPAIREALARSRELVKLADDVPLDIEVQDLVRRDWDEAALLAIFQELEFNRYIQRLKATFVPDRDAYETITDAAALTALLEAAARARELAVTVHTATPDGDATQLCGIALAIPNRPPAYVPLSHRYIGAPEQLSRDAVIGALGPLLRDPAITRTVHGTKRTWMVLGAAGLEPAGIRCDVELASYLLDASRADHSLETLARQHLSHDHVKYADVVGTGKGATHFDEADVGAATRYAAEGAGVTLALGKLLRERLEGAELAALHDDLEVPLGRVLAIMERHGIRLDVPVLTELSARLGKTCETLDREIQELAGKPINVGSPKQLSELLFGDLGLRAENMRKTTHGFSTDASVLEELKGQHPIVEKILQYRELTKLKGTYLDALPPLVAKDGRLHTRYSQTVASTGRLASTNPNIQNIPIRTELGREIRKAFVADDGHVLVSADYSQIELRVLAHLSRDKVLCEAFANDVDVHAQTAAEVFGVPLAEVTADMRRVAKAVNYGLGYGQTDYGLARALDIPREEARRYIETYFARFSGVREFMDRHIAEAKKTQVVKTILGRRLPIPMITSRRYTERAAAERLARNAPIQGSAADILKLAMLAIQKELDDRKSDARMLLTVHDELVFEVPAGQAEPFAAFAKGAMESAYRLEVPLKVDVGISKTWAGAH